MQAARDAVAEVRGGLRGTARIGTLISAGFVDLPGCSAGTAPSTPPSTCACAPPRPARRASRRACWTGSLPGRAPAGLSVRTLAAEPIVAVLPAAHPLAARPRLTLADLAEEPFVDSPPGYGDRAEVDRGFAAAGLRRRVAVEVTGIATVRQSVREGLGVALIPRFPAPDEPGLGAVPIDAELRWTFAIATASGRRPSAAVRARLDLVDAYRI
ncbi:LysR substrate-binding domain-containing protein [Dactylosporangium sp. CA-139114]|uniref:LysR substrate-binding domain-containing protein n=1 Tax=Dactylosporangium sp. CA-139114 TaxID=3239931 RepID=UPI003D989867